jgi:hypothetical protein
MRPIWKQLPRENSARGSWAALYVTMKPNGEIVMSRVTWERLGGPAAFHILFDEANNRIGLKPTVLQMRDAYKACVKGRRGGRCVNAYRLTQDYNIRLTYTIQFHDAEIDHDGILILDLRTARISQRSANHPRNRKKKETSDRAE